MPVSRNNTTKIATGLRLPEVRHDDGMNPSRILIADEHKAR
jgi:hypothetical protein